jgi:muramoyltetrapeptide carboxypeptidase LdcA involved in peptidoglycan recycling
VGGNLSVFSAMIGSPYLTIEQMKGAILFLEGSSLRRLLSTRRRVGCTSMAHSL